MEIIDRHDTNTYRAVYAMQFPNAIYVLHAFQKKSKSGIAFFRFFLAAGGVDR
jgi:phage-related protein